MQLFNISWDITLILNISWDIALIFNICGGEAAVALVSEGTADCQSVRVGLSSDIQDILISLLPQ